MKVLVLRGFLKYTSVQSNIARQNIPSIKRLAHNLMQIQAKTTQNLDKFALRKMQVDMSKKSEAVADSLEAWIESYLLNRI